MRSTNGVPGTRRSRRKWVFTSNGQRLTKAGRTTKPPAPPRAKESATIRSGQTALGVYGDRHPQRDSREISLLKYELCHTCELQRKGSVIEVT